MAFTNALGSKQDPLQGYDIKVTTVASNGSSSGALVGAFTSLMFKIVNQTETYLPLNSRIPRMLDGEVIVVWSLEQGLVEMDVVANTFGADFATGFSGGRGSMIPRSRRFNILFEAQAMIGAKAGGVDNDTYWIDGPTAAGSQGTGGTLSLANIQGSTALKYGIMSARVDTFSFGVAAGRHVVANAWQGTAEHLKNWTTGTPAKTP